MATNSLKLGLDLDGVITETPEFFSAWTHSWPGEVVIITYRKDRQKAVQDLADRNIRYDEFAVTDRFSLRRSTLPSGYRSQPKNCSGCKSDRWNFHTFRDVCS